MNERRYELDWLRVFGILVVFLYHSTRFFNLDDWHVKNIDTYVWVEIWNVFATRWMMPLFFTISGASLFHAIGKPGGLRRFYTDKFLRLMIPVMVAVLTHSAVQVYLEQLSHNRYTGSFFSFMREYLDGLYLSIGGPGNFPFHGMHLWYLLFLFIYSMLCYRLFNWLKGGGARVLGHVTNLMATPGLMYLWLSLPLLIIWALVPDAVLNVGQGGWGFLYYLWFLIAGFIIMSSDNLQRQIKKQRRMSLARGLVFMLAYLFQIFSRSRLALPEPAGDCALALLNFLSAWCLLSAILGFGMRYLAFDRPFLRRANEGVLPFYVMHQSVLVVIGFWVVTWSIPDFLKWMIIFTMSFIILISIYRRLIRKYDVLRFVFGMKTSTPFYDVFQKGKSLAGFHALYLGLFTFALVNQITGPTAVFQARTMRYDPQRDIVLSCDSITNQSPVGVMVVEDEGASAGRAIEWSFGGARRIEPRPEVFVEMALSAPAGTYVVWLRGKTEVDDILTDSIHFQWDQYIGTGKGVYGLGNWLDIHPPGTYGWASHGARPARIVFKHNGRHTIRLQPRQTPHRIDQIWLSRFQWAVPETSEPIGSLEVLLPRSGESAPVR